MSVLANRRKQAQADSPKKETSSGSRIEYVSVGESLQDFVENHYFGKINKKDGEGLIGRARNLYKYVINKLLEDRSQERPKQFKFTGQIEGAGEHVVTVNVKEQGYRAIDDGTLGEVREICGDAFTDAHFKLRIQGNVDFSLIPEDKHDAVASKLEEIDAIVGTKVAEFEFMSMPREGFHGARASLTTEQDTRLNKVMPIPVAFGR